MNIAALILTINLFLFLIRRIYKRTWNKKLYYNMSFFPKNVFEGEKLILTESLANKKRLPLPWVAVSYKINRKLVFLDETGAAINRGDERVSIFVIGANKSLSRKSEVICGTRGYHKITRITISSANIMLTDRFSASKPSNYSITVYPKFIDMPDNPVPYKKMAGYILTKRYINPDPFEFKSIREYQPYDSFRQINFKATAKTGTLMSNVYDFTISQDITILLNLQDYCQYNRDIVHEDAIRLAAFLCRYYTGEGIPVGFICPAPSCVTGEIALIKSGLSKLHLDVIYTALAHIDLNAVIPGISDFLQTEGSYANEYINEKVYVLISSYHGEDLKNKYFALKERGVRILWIVPKLPRDPLNLDISDEDIALWETTNDVADKKIHSNI